MIKYSYDKIIISDNSDKVGSCQEIEYYIPSAGTGFYEIEIEGKKIKVRCEMTGKTTGWTVSLTYTFFQIYFGCMI